MMHRSPEIDVLIGLAGAVVVVTVSATVVEEESGIVVVGVVGVVEVESIDEDEEEEEEADEPPRLSQRTCQTSSSIHFEGDTRLTSQ